MAAAGIALLVVAQLADYVTFLLMVARHGLETELNPLVVTLAGEHGLALLTVAKLAVIVLAASVFLVVGRTRPKVAAVVLVAGIVAGGLGAFSNILTIQAA